MEEFKSYKICFPDHNRIKLEINDIKISGKFPNTWKLNNIHLNKPHVKGEVTKTKEYLEMYDNKNTNDICKM